MAAPVKATAAKVQQRPAESATLVVGALAFLVGKAFNWDAQTVGAVTVLVGAVPSVVTWWDARRKK
jgi:hypothetical protein